MASMCARTCAVDNDVNPRNYLGKFWIDSLVHDPQTLQYITDVVGENKICLGSDYPFPLGEHHPGKLIESMDSLSATTVEKLLYKNALDWMELEPQSHLI